MGRKSKNFVEQMIARFPAGTFARIGPTLRAGETRTDFVQEAVEAEIKRREKAKS